ncbi:hypothetical protein GGF46_004243 [Coemansia sp. RSA 552]|nr:hypothetical protein GGF46_004243 [Coemansia sp. RSA 552]
MFGINVESPDGHDTTMIVVCSCVFGLTAIMLVYVWCNYNYQPIRAKNPLWTTLIYLSTVLWFVGNLTANGHMRLVGVWSHCKFWTIWLRVGCCFLFSSMTAVRMYALFRVFVQKKPFTRIISLLSAVVAVMVSVIYCLVNQLIPSRLTIEYNEEVEVCDGAQGFRVAAITFQWIVWAVVAVLIFRLRNIQSSFNEFRESLAIFAVVIVLLIESTVINIHFKEFPLLKARRIEKTCVDVAASTLVVWIFIGYPVYMSIFHRHRYEQQWLERLAKDRQGPSYNMQMATNSDTPYAKIIEANNGLFSDDTFNLAYASVHRPFEHRFNTLNIESVFNGDSANYMFASRAQVHDTVVHPPLVLSEQYEEPFPGERHVL